MRPIDADGLFAEIKVRHDMFADCEYIGDKARRDELSSFMADIVNAPTIGGWISVKDKLPEVGKVVLAFGTRSATTGMFQGIGTRNDLWWWKGHTIKHVSHWMPLPEPPKEDDA